ncbi:DUF916 and DUF3324 domain-containing protein [Apilactobacillus xinyiensis]|uniref:DUF916 and DUF3324 domain-containing protein n=1 Tax=Apilactobacillus xinyiensis TaxID=2841032 RepID=UPI00200F87A5|nr:DUF916 and DUF3324 domain-containing protein [Apilactobacillus xinyiensis]MCL0330823.1 DUF916 and DUF3324 domain-containing protein [Apilactobacillus xinyiensis]
MQLFKKKYFAFLAVLIGIFTLFNIQASANGVNGIAMQPIYPSNQITKNGIINPQVKPGDTQELSFNIINLSNESIKASITPNTAVTSDTPSIDYSKSKYKYDNSLKYSFKDIFHEGNITKTLAPHKVTKISFTAHIPDKKFSGLLMGAFYISTNKTYMNNSSATPINNKYTYAMPVILKEDHSKAVPKLTLGDVYTSTQNNTPQVNSRIYNKHPAIIDNMTIETFITDANGKRIYHMYHNNNSVAPNSNFTYRSLISDKNILNPGKYHIKIIAKSDEGKWILQKDFSVGVAQYLSTILQDNSWLWWLILLLILLIILIIIYIIYKKIKSKKENEKVKNTGKHFK